MRFLKYFSIVVVLLLGVLLVAPFLIDVDQYKTEIEQKVEDATGRALHIGKIQASLFPWIGLKLQDVDFANANGFSSPSFLKVGRLDVQIAFLPLLQQKIELKRFELQAPEINLERSQDGIGNWEDLQQGNVSPSTAGDAGNGDNSATMLFAFVAESIALNNGRIRWQDATTGQDITLKNIQLSLLDVQQERPISIHASVSIGDDQITLKGKVGPVGDMKRLIVERVPVQLELSSSQLGLAQFSALLPDFPARLGDKKSASVAMAMKLEQRPDGLRSSDGLLTLNAAHKIALQWIVEQQDAQHIQLKSSSVSLDGQLLLHTKGNITLQANATPQISLQLNTETITREWLSSLLPELTAMYANHPKPWTQLSVGLALKLAGDTIDLKGMKIHLDQDLLTLSGRYTMTKNPRVRLRLRAAALHIDPWLPVASEPSQQAKDATTTEAAVEPDFRPFATWNVNLQSSIGQLYVKNVMLNDVVVNIQSNQGTVDIKPASFGIAGGTVREIASLNISSYPVLWRESVRVKDVNLGPLLQQFAHSDQLDGRLQLTTNLRGKGLLPNAIKASLNGKGKMAMTNGKVKGFDIAHALRNITSLGKQKTAQYTDFAQLQASFTARDGVLHNNDLFMASPLFRLTGKGLVNLPASTMDYHMRPKLVATLVGQGDQANARTGITIPLHIVGAFDSPSITPEIDAASLVGSVKNVFKGNGTGVADTLKGASSTPTQAVKEKVNKALGGLIPGF